MKGLKKHQSALCCFLILILSNLPAIASKSSNEKKSLDSQESHLCIKQGVSLESQQCADIIKQSQLQSEKLSPQVRSTDIEADKQGFHMSEISPFIGGASGQVD